MKLRTLLLFAALSISNGAFAAVTISPPSPRTADTITIRVENTFGAEARATSATIAQSGNTFTIQQNVERACTLPSNPVVASQFQVGPLPPGTYNVIANIVFTGLPPMLCSPAPVTQTATFTVTSGADIPAIGPVGLLLLGAVLAAVALTVLRR